MFIVINDTKLDLNNMEVDFNYNSNGYTYIALKTEFLGFSKLDWIKEQLNQKISFHITEEISVFKEQDIKDIHYKIYTENNKIYEYVRIVI